MLLNILLSNNQNLKEIPVFKVLKEKFLYCPGLACSRLKALAKSVEIYEALLVLLFKIPVSGYDTL